MNFLAELFDSGYSYSSLNAYHSAISSADEKVDGHKCHQGCHPLVLQYSNLVDIIMILKYW